MRSLLARVGTAAFVVFGLALVLPRGSRTATSDPEPPPIAPLGLPPHPMFTPYAADEGALTFEELSAEEQEVIEAERSAIASPPRFARRASRRTWPLSPSDSPACAVRADSASPRPCPGMPGQEAKVAQPNLQLCSGRDARCPRTASMRWTPRGLLYCGLLSRDRLC